MSRSLVVFQLKEREGRRKRRKIKDPSGMPAEAVKRQYRSYTLGSHRQVRTYPPRGGPPRGSLATKVFIYTPSKPSMEYRRRKSSLSANSIRVIRIVPD